MTRNYKSRTVKLEDVHDFSLRKYCEQRGCDVSTFIREAILEKMNSNHVSNIAGKNKIEYRPKTDSFIWKIELDSGEEQIVLENLSPDFVQDLQKQLSFELHKRAESLSKKKKSFLLKQKEE